MEQALDLVDDAEGIWEAYTGQELDDSEVSLYGTLIQC